MKKLMLIALALVGLVATDASAYRRYWRNYGYYNGGCGSCATACEPCKPACCVEGPKICKTVEEPVQECPECVKYVKVAAPCNVTRHIYYSCECPEGYVQEGTISAEKANVKY